ncbi:hypothetical protein L1787_16560 [Acuticoccus sp. M5D2P5]|uniref:phage head-tail joining protein n=1 Tax=Acuticoccus kalidii TaxID=2910977 RepID=UPI001F34434A|nr:hypothetical protein [Acuticoccus kalidii]MCF3935018.1 hypothetical protein [Acuticoccus kalidii]
MVLTPEREALLREWLGSLEEALASGAQRIVFHSGGTRREVEYRSRAEMRSEMRKIKAELGMALPSNTTVTTFSSGFY